MSTFVNMKDFPFPSEAALHCVGDWFGGSKLSVLYLTNKLRHRPDSGGARREHEILRRLAPRIDLHYVALTPDFDEERAVVMTLQLPFASVTLVRTGAEAPEIGRRPAAAWEERFARHAASIGCAVTFWLSQRYAPTIVHSEGCFLLQHVDSSLGRPLVLLEENVESALGRDRACFVGSDPSGSSCANCNKGGEEDEEAAASAAVERFETALWRRADSLVAVTDEDANVMRARVPGVPVTCLPNGGTPAAAPLLNAESGRALYVANFAWDPSRDACLYLLHTLWPLVLARKPSAHLLLAGAGMDAALRARAKKQAGVEVIGPFGSFCEVASRAAVCISPLRFGGGHKMKIVDALCAGLPIVATPLSLRGFSPFVREAVVVADHTEAFAGRTADLLSTPEACRRLGRASLQAAATLPDWHDIADGLAHVWANAAAKLRHDVSSTPEEADAPAVDGK